MTQMIQEETRYDAGQPGDTPPMLEWFYAHHSDYYNYAVSRIGTRHRPIMPEDIIQQVALRVWRSAPVVEEKLWRNYFYRAVQNACCDALRKTQLLPLPEGWDVPSEETEESGCAEQVETVLGMVSEHSRQILVMHYFEGLDFQQISGRLGRPVGTVKSRIFSGRQQFKRIWEGLYGPQTDELDKLAKAG